MNRLREWLSRARARLQRGPRRSALAGLLLLGAFAAVVAACTRTKTLEFLITVPKSLANDTHWIEVSVYDNVQCSLAGRVAYGEAPVAGPVKRLLFSPGDDMSKVPALGDLPSGYYSFVAQVKNAKCQVIARGCDGLDIGSSDTVRIGTKPDGDIGPECGDGLSCQQAQCIPQRGGQNCSLDVIGSGPLSVYTDPNDQRAGQETEGLAVAAPAVRALTDKFLTTYGQFNVDDGTKTIGVAQPIARNGGLFKYTPTEYLRRCVNFPQDDGTGLAWNPTDAVGMVAMARTECDATGEAGETAVELFGFDNDVAAVRTATISLSVQDRTGPLTFGQNHAVASLGGGQWVLAPVIAGQAEAVFLRETGDAPSGGFEVLTQAGAQVRIPFGLADATQTSAAVDVSPSSIVMVAVNESATVVTPPDAGEDDDGGFDPDAGGDDDDSGGTGFRAGELGDVTSQVSVQFLPIDKITNPGTLPAPFVRQSRFASVALVDNRAFVVADGDSLSDPNLYAIDFDPADNAGAPPTAYPQAILTNGEAQSSAVDYADVAVAYDRLFVATAIPGDIVLTLFGTAATNPTVLQSIKLSQVRASTVGSIRDGRVSVTVDRNRVIVVWTTAKQLKANDPMGGYVIFACEPPT